MFIFAGKIKKYFYNVILSIFAGKITLYGLYFYKVKMSIFASRLKNLEFMWPSLINWSTFLYAYSPDIFEELHKYAKENLLWLNVYVKDSFATRIIRDERMTRTSFIANVGGLLGLCMGFSLVSVVEILYFCAKRAFKPGFSLQPKTKSTTNGNNHRNSGRNYSTTSLDIAQNVSENISMETTALPLRSSCIEP